MVEVYFLHSERTALAGNVVKNKRMARNRSTKVLM